MGFGGGRSDQKSATIGGPERLVRIGRTVGDAVSAALALLPVVAAIAAFTFRYIGPFTKYEYLLAYIAALFGALSAAILYRRLVRSRAQNTDCAKIFENIAYQNCDCDKVIFDKLNHILNDGPDKEVALYDVISKVDENIKYILDRVCKLFRAYTGHPCAASIKSIYSAEGSDLHSTTLKTIFRDPDSKSERGNEDDSVTYNIHQNTAYVDIILNKEPYFASNNLKGLAGYKNAHRGWDRLYNSTLVVGIPSLQPDEIGAEFASLICVDSLQGKLDNDTCRLYLRELTWRLAVMLYRMEKLRRDFKPLVKGK